MCGIIGIFNHPDAKDKIRSALASLHNRGKDGCGVASETEIVTNPTLRDLPLIKGNHLLGHTLHAVVDHVSQPLRREGVLSTNCEIYNWKELAKKFSLKARNDADLLLQLFEKFGTEKVDELDGVYAAAYWKKDTVTLIRDILGEKPLWFTHTNGSFAFASEKKVLEKIGFTDIQELNPRSILRYTISTNTYSIQRRNFFHYLPEHQEDIQRIRERTTELLHQAIEKRIPQQKFGVLFSGGIDSTYLAKFLKDRDYEFTCYTAVLDNDTVPPSDLLAAQEIAQQLHLNLKIKKVKIDEIPPLLQKIVPLIEDSNVTKVGVALTFYLACEMAKEDGCKVIFSGLGSEEIFAGYERHKQSANINQECVSGLIKLYERDLYRDDVLTMDNNLELRLPYLDKELITYSLKIPPKYKIDDLHTKIILRTIAQKEGIPEEFAFRRKVAAQYGSRIDNAIERLSKKQGYTSKSTYLQQFYPRPNLKLGVLFSSGKDSTAAAYIMKQQNYALTCLITLKSQNSHSYMFQSAGVEIVELQAQAMELPLIIQETTGEKEIELLDLEKALRQAKEQYHIDGIVSGALFSTYQRDRIEKICDNLGLKIFSPLWHKQPDAHMEELFHAGFEIIFTAVAAEGLDKSWLNRPITKIDIERLKKIREKTYLNIAGEGGEFESVVLDCPLFQKKIKIQSAEIIEEKKNTATLLIHQATLIPKKI
ncbi:diphthine--ammonia ligase [Candidatus Woesearchaeota archaeon]|nr:diphthine--ammonia ligase [Candidatus Woesearchaeota archaeon]